MSNGKTTLDMKKGEHKLPDGWSIKALSELGVFSKGKGISKEQLQEAGLPCIRYGEIYTTHDYVVKQFSSYIDESTAAESKSIKKGDVLFAGSGEKIEDIGKAVAYMGNELVYAGGDIIILSCNEPESAVCISYALETDAARRQKRRLGQGHSVVHIYPRDLAKVAIPLPPLPEQRAIAACLGTWDKAIDALQQLIAAKEERKKWLMQVLLTGKKRLVGFEGEWEEVRLGEVTRNVSRRNKKLIDATVYSVTNTSAGFVPQSEHFDREVAGDDRTNHKIIHHGEFAYNPARINVGSIAYFKGDVGIISSLYVIFKTTEDLMDSFLHYWLQTDLAKYRIESYGEGGVRVYLFYDLFSTIKILLPPLEEQEAIASVLLTADRELTLLIAKRDKLRDEKRGLMQGLLTGRKRINN